ncbi:MAG: hypothetical protein KDI83_19425 [Gammaproteobacteria bacterium]|nr:hypothetical protein [Gammaproteobacteria bacterium]
MSRHAIRELLDSLDFGRMLPEDYAAYRPLLIDGLSYFLEQLPEQRLSGILMEQFSLGAACCFTDRLLSLLHQCPTLHKLGQIVARDRRLSIKLRQCLQQLESISPNSQLEKLPAHQLQTLQHIPGIKLGRQPLAEASIAVIVPFTWTDKSQGKTGHGVFKLLKEGVTERLLQELEIWRGLGSFLEERCAYHGLPPLDYRETLESMCLLLRQEVCFEQEQQHLLQASAYYANEPHILVPRLLPFCTDEITAMERIDGCKVTDAPIPLQRRNLLADRLLGCMIAKPFWDPAEETMFHADPHAGNLFCTRDEKLALLDWTLAGRLQKQQRIDLIQIALGGITQEAARVCQAIEHLGQTQADGSRLRSCVDAALREVRQGHFPGFAWAQRLLDSVALANVMSFPRNLVLFRKTLLTLSSVVADIAENSSVDQIMLATGAREFFTEAPQRMLAHPTARTFGTHLSNLDLLALWYTAPNSAAAYWLGAWQDCLTLLRGRA